MTQPDKSDRDPRFKLPEGAGKILAPLVAEMAAAFETGPGCPLPLLPSAPSAPSAPPRREEDPMTQPEATSAIALGGTDSRSGPTDGV